MKQIAIEIIDDDEFNLDKHFFVRLSNATSSVPGIKVKIDHPRATVTILDNDHGGIFEFDNSRIEISETVNTAKIKVHMTYTVFLPEFIFGNDKSHRIVKQNISKITCMLKQGILVFSITSFEKLIILLAIVFLSIPH